MTNEEALSIIEEYNYLSGLAENEEYFFQITLSDNFKTISSKYDEALAQIKRQLGLDKTDNFAELRAVLNGKII